MSLGAPGNPGAPGNCSGLPSGKSGFRLTLKVWHQTNSVHQFWLGLSTKHQWRQHKVLLPSPDTLARQVQHLYPRRCQTVQFSESTFIHLTFLQPDISLRAALNPIWISSSPILELFHLSPMAVLQADGQKKQWAVHCFWAKTCAFLFKAVEFISVIGSTCCKTEKITD